MKKAILLIIMISLISWLFSADYVDPTFGDMPLSTTEHISADTYISGDSLNISGNAVFDGDVTVDGAVVFDSMDVSIVTVDTLTINVLGTMHNLTADTAAITRADISDIDCDSVNSTIFVGDITGNVTSTVSGIDTLTSLVVNADSINSDNYAGIKAYIPSITCSVITGNNYATIPLNIDGYVDITGTFPAGASVQNLVKATLGAGLTYSGTTAAWAVKSYDADNTVLHNGGEDCALYINMKRLSAELAGGKSVALSIHNYGSGGDYQIIDAGVWEYGNFVDGFKISGGSIETGLDLSETAVTVSDIQGHNGEIIFNDPDGTWGFGDADLLTTGDITADSIGVAHAYASVGFVGDLDGNATSANQADTSTYLGAGDGVVAFHFGLITWTGNTEIIKTYSPGIENSSAPGWALTGDTPADFTVSLKCVDDTLYFHIDNADTATATGKVFSYTVFAPGP